MNANQNKPVELLDFYSDPACGWALVPWATFAEHHIDPAMFSNYSHADAFGAYLEEDHDLPKFLAEFENTSGRRVAFNDIRHSKISSSPVRRKVKLHAYPYEDVLLDIVSGDQRCSRLTYGCRPIEENKTSRLGSGLLLQTSSRPLRIKKGKRENEERKNG